MTPLEAFSETITKSAAGQQSLLRAAGRFMASAPRGAAVGGGLGALAGAATASPEEGVVSGAMRGGVIGATLGAGAGGTASAYRNTRLLDPTLTAGGAVMPTIKRIGGELKNFGKRQLHGFTGAYGETPGAIGLRSTEEAGRRAHLQGLRTGAEQADIIKSFESSPKTLRDRAHHHEMWEKAREAHDAEMKSLKEWGVAGDAAHRAGITSLPGLAKGLVKNPVDTGKALVHDLGGNTGAAMAVGLPLAFAAPGLLRGDETATGGPSMGHKLVGAASGVLGGVATSGLPLVPQMVAGMGLDVAAEKALNALHRRRHPEVAT